MVYVPIDGAKFHAFFESFRPFVRSIAWRYVLDFEDADDVTQQVFLNAWRGAKTFRGGNIKGWLAILSKNASRDLVRKRKVSFIELATLANVRGADNVEDEVTATVNGEWIRRAVQELPQGQRDVVIASFWDGLSHEAIARSALLPLGTVKTRIRSALHRLRRRADAVQVA